MRPLTASDVILLWERAARSAGAERALLPLAVACPELTWQELLRLPIGRRDALLLDLYRATFGERLDLYVRCPACGEDLELDLDAGSLRSRARADQDREEIELVIDGLSLVCRLPCSEDLELAGADGQRTDPGLTILEHCLVQAERDGEPVRAAQLAEHEVARLAEAISEADPFSELLVDLDCFACRHSWQAQIELSECLWPEITAAARCVIREVHLLARHYGWREADILSMSSRRRRCYLEMLGT